MSAGKNDNILSHSDPKTETSSVTSLPPKSTTIMIPQSEDGDVTVNVIARIGSEVFFDYRIPISEGHLLYHFCNCVLFIASFDCSGWVWIYVNPKSRNLTIETISTRSYGTHGTSSFKAPDNFRLKIGSVKHVDEGFYKCDWNPHHNQVKQVFLKVTSQYNRLY
ncbi:hypothetical protein J6590_081188 [Homalodisca vitripennis]|nr:hypothetical protein J6590_081188 [Homalodisca vitripennis]